MPKTKVLPALALGTMLLAGVSLLPAAKIRVGGNVAQANLVSQTRPAYPPEAKRNHVQGVVRLNVDIGTDGRVQHVEVESGPPELVEAAVTAVTEWVYKPVLLNGEAVEVATTVDVNFTLAQ